MKKFLVGVLSFILSTVMFSGLQFGYAYATSDDDNTVLTQNNVEGNQQEDNQTEGNQIVNTQNTENQVEGTQNSENQVEGTQNSENQVEGTQNPENQVEGTQNPENQVEGTQNTQNRLLITRNRVSEQDVLQENRDVQVTQQPEYSNTNRLSETQQRQQTRFAQTQDTSRLSQNPVEYKVTVATKVVDEQGNPVKGATIQILNSYGEVVDEWKSDGNEHETSLPKGEYKLYQKVTPDGYAISQDTINFTANVKLDAKAWSMYENSIPVYYVDVDGNQVEAYCVSEGKYDFQNVNYVGQILDPSNIRRYMPSSDYSMTDVQLYNRVLDIVYHRSKANAMFPELTDAEIRLITEYALNNTSAMINDGWNNSANTQYNSYTQLFNYLVSTQDPHPDDMYLVVYSAESSDYPNLLGTAWVNPYNSKFKVNLKLVNSKSITIYGYITWEDANNQDKIRPDSVVINLLANGSKVKIINVTAENNWKFSFDNLPKYQDGKEIEYTLTEEPVNGYTIKVNGFNVINTHTPATGTSNNTSNNTPQTEANRTSTSVPVTSTLGTKSNTTPESNKTTSNATLATTADNTYSERVFVISAMVLITGDVCIRKCKV